MRLLRRTGSNITIAPRAVQTDALGGVTERFSDERITLWGNVSVVSNTLNSTANALVSTAAGMRVAQALRLRFIGRVKIAVGDGVLLPGDAEPTWRCVEVSQYPLMTLARIERIAAAEAEG